LVWYPPLIKACDWGETEIARLLLEKGADVNLDDWNGETALMKCCYDGKIEIANLLIEKGANVNEWSYVEDENVLMRSVISGSIETVKLLISAGVDVNESNLEGETALSLARRFGYPEIAQLLIAAGAKE
jgi:ankyrin repeat protein